MTEQQGDNESELEAVKARLVTEQSEVGNVRNDARSAAEVKGLFLKITDAGAADDTHATVRLAMQLVLFVFLLWSICRSGRFLQRLINRIAYNEAHLSDQVLITLIICISAKFLTVLGVMAYFIFSHKKKEIYEDAEVAPGDIWSKIGKAFVGLLESITKKYS